MKEALDVYGKSELTSAQVWKKLPYDWVLMGARFSLFNVRKDIVKIYCLQTQFTMKANQWFLLPCRKMFKISHFLKKDERVLCLGENGCFPAVFHREPRASSELNPMWSCVIIKHSTLQCLGSAVPRIYFSSLAIHLHSEELLAQFSLICIYFQFFHPWGILKSQPTSNALL